MDINYKIINQSIDFYRDRGFIQTEVPWIVDKDIEDITKKPDKISFPFKEKYLIGSGEQGFLQRIFNDNLEKGKYQTITPCFRDDVLDIYHQNYFLKNELISTSEVDEKNLKKIIGYSYDFFTLFFGNKIKIKKTEEGFDIEINNIELGSYGIREHRGTKWIYGTGLAEPRTSILINTYGLSQN